MMVHGGHIEKLSQREVWSIEKGLGHMEGVE